MFVSFFELIFFELIWNLFLPERQTSGPEVVHVVAEFTFGDVALGALLWQQEWGGNVHVSDEGETVEQGLSDFGVNDEHVLQGFHLSVE